MNSKDIERILPDYKLTGLVAENGNERIYQAEKDNGSEISYSVVKAYFFPYCDDDKEKISFSSSEEQKKYVSSQMKKYKNELTMFRSFCGRTGWLVFREGYDYMSVDDMSGIIVSRYDFAYTIGEYIEKNGLTEGSLLKLGIDICMGLEYTVKNNLVHGSIKLDDIFADDSHKFRMARIDPDTVEKRRVFDDGDILKMAYTSPECAAGASVTNASDIYSVGLIMYTLMNGMLLPFEGELGREQAIRKRISGEKIPRPAFDCGRLTDIVMKAVSVEKQDRYQSPYSMRKELESEYTELENRINQRLEREKAERIQREKERQLAHPEESDISAYREKIVNEPEKKKKSKKTSKKRTFIIVAALILVLSAAGLGGYKYHRSFAVFNHKASRDKSYSCVYDGTEKTPPILIEGLTEGVDYTVEYTDNVYVGTAKAVISGTGKYYGERVYDFTIIPSVCPDLKAVEVKENSVTVTWGEAMGCDRYWLYIFNDETGNWDRIDSVHADTLEYTFEELEGQTEYRLMVRGVYGHENASGEKDYFKGVINEITVKTK